MSDGHEERFATLEAVQKTAKGGASDETQRNTEQTRERIWTSGVGQFRTSSQDHRFRSGHERMRPVQSQRTWFGRFIPMKKWRSCTFLQSTWSSSSCMFTPCDGHSTWKLDCQRSMHGRVRLGWLRGLEGRKAANVKPLESFSSRTLLRSILRFSSWG